MSENITNTTNTTTITTTTTTTITTMNINEQKEDSIKNRIDYLLSMKNLSFYLSNSPPLPPLSSSPLLPSPPPSEEIKQILNSNFKKSKVTTIINNINISTSLTSSNDNQNSSYSSSSDSDSYHNIQ